MLDKIRKPHFGVIVPVAVVVILAGSVAAAGAASANRISPGLHNGVHGIVTSVNGNTSTLGACVASDTGTFTMVGAIRQGIVTVNVASTTTYTDAAIVSPATPSFADVCVGGQVEVLGTLSSGALAATAVTIVPAQAQGIVSSVTAGITTSTTEGSCGTAGSPQSFTLVDRGHRAIVTVDVGGGTTFTDAALTPPTLATFADVCVGGQVEVLGTLSSGALAATLVTIVPAQAQGIVASVTVDGGAASSAPGACGGADEAGSFTLGSAWPMPVLAIATWPVTTVDVTSSTTFTDAAVVSPATPSFADVCVGGQVEALGTLFSGALAATAVTIVPAQAQGIVASVTVDGGAASSAPGTCGKTGETGSFTLAGITPLPVLAIGSRLVTTVDVTSSTTFTDAAVVSPATPSFADVCVGTNVRAIGTVADGTLTAASVAVLPAVQLPIGHGNRGGHGRS
jgi:hypothetical protein